MATDAELRRAPDPRLHLELGLLKLVNAKRLAPLEEVLAELRGESTGPKPAGGSSSGPSFSKASAGAAGSLGGASSGGARLAPATTQAVSSSGAAAKMAPARAFEIAPKPSNVVESAAPKLAIEPRAASPALASFAGPAESPAGARSEVNATDALPVAVVMAPLVASDGTKTLTSEQVEAIRALLQGSKFLLSMLDAVTSWEVGNGELRLFFHPDNRSLSEMLQSRDTMERLRTALNQVLGQPLRVCVKLDSSRGASPTLQSSEKSSELRARFEQDPIVRVMLEKFGGQISNVKRPGGE
jgi:DNA polymerase-3 subunit gamma/tau